MAEHDQTWAHVFQMARDAYPGPVGELCVRELQAWSEFGYRLSNDALMSRLLDHLLADPIPEPAPVPEPKPRVRLFPPLRTT